MIHSTVSRMIAVVLLVAAVAAVGTVPVHATVLTFDKTPQFGAGNPVDGPVSATNFADYGDRVTNTTMDASAARSQAPGTTVFSYGATAGFTPNIVADYPTGMQVYRDGSVVNDYPTAPVLYPAYSGDTPKRRMLTLTADTGFQTVLRSFTLEEYGTTARNYQYLAVVGIDALNNETVLWQLGSIGGGTIATIPGNSPGIVYNGSNFGTEMAALKIAIDFQAGVGPGSVYSAFGFDNITFAQIIPEPSAIMLLAVGSALMLRRRWTG